MTFLLLQFIMKFGFTPLNFDIINENLDLGKINFPILVKKAIDRGFKHIEVTMDLNYVIPGALSKKCYEIIG